MSKIIQFLETRTCFMQNFGHSNWYIKKDFWQASLWWFSLWCLWSCKEWISSLVKFFTNFSGICAYGSLFRFCSSLTSKPDYTSSLGRLNGTPYSQLSGVTMWVMFLYWVLLSIASDTKWNRAIWSRLYQVGYFWYS